MVYKNNFVVVVKCNGRILREHDGNNIYLPFGSNYSILLKNKDARRALVEIEVDGKNVLNGHKLIVDGNTSQEIKGFMRNMKKTNKFKFINKTKDIQNYRGDRIDDGLIRVTYQFEEVVEAPIKPLWSPGNYDVYHDLKKGGQTQPGNFDVAYFSACSCSTDSFSPRHDEGITVKGDKVSQNYSYGDIGSLEAAIHTIVLQLIGKTKSRKRVKRPITVKTKISCGTCGRRNRATNKFCYNCGTYLR
jgi:hypothetical protein